MSEVVVDITQTSTSVTVEQNEVDVAITQTSTSVSLGNAGPQGTQGVQGPIGPTGPIGPQGPAGEDAVSVGFVDGNYYTVAGAAGTDVQFAIGYVHYLPFVNPADGTNITRLGVNLISTALSNNVILGIYDSDADNLPSSKLAQTASITTGTGAVTGFKYETVDVTLDKGLYWLAFVNRGSVPSTFNSINFREQFVSQGTFAEPPTTVYKQNTGFIESGVTGDLPNTATPRRVNYANFPRIFFGVGS